MLAYFPGLRGPLMFDDYPNIVNNPLITSDSFDFDNLQTIFTHHRPLATLSFTLNYHQSNGLDNTIWFKATNLAIHIINTLLILWLTRLLLTLYQTNFQKYLDQQIVQWLPYLITAVWALHPINLTSVLYVVQRMTSLATMFMLIGLICFIIGRQHYANSPRRGLFLMIAGVAGGTLFGLLAKEIALLLSLYALAIDRVFFRNHNCPIVVRIFHVFSIGILVIAAGYYFISQPDRLTEGYTLREFTLPERLLTESRALWFYISLILFPVPGRFSLFHDDIALSTGLLSPWTTLLSSMGIMASVALAIIAHRKSPVLAFGIFWFLVGHCMESTAIGLELVHEHRNYLPAFGPIFSLGYGAAWVATRFGRPRQFFFLFTLIALTFGFSTSAIATQWSDKASLVTYLVKHHPDSARAHATLADYLLTEKRDSYTAMQEYLKAGDIAPHETAFLIRAVHIAAMFDFALIPNINPDYQLLLTPAVPRTITPTNTEARSFISNPLIHEIEHRLKTQPIHLRVVETLRWLADCVQQQPQRCGRLYKTVVDWHWLALKNMRTNDDMRKRLYTQLVSLYLSVGDHDSAFASVNLARQFGPTEPYFLLMEANVCLLRGDHDKARNILKQLEIRENLDSENRRQLEKLRELLISRQ